MYESLKSAHDEFAIFALLMPEDSGGRWDLVVSAPWLKGNLADYGLMAKALRRHLTNQEIQTIERTVIIPTDNPALKQIMDGNQTIEESTFIGTSFEFGGVRVRRAYILRLTPPSKLRK